MNSTKTVKPNKSTRKIIILIQCFILTVLILFHFLYEPFDFQSESLIYPFCCLLCGLTIWSCWSWYILTKSLFNPYLLFLLSAILFNSGQAVLEVFHLNKDGILGDLDFLLDLSSKNILDTLFLIILGLGAFHLGALIRLAIVKDHSDNCKIEKKDFTLRSRNSYVIGWRLLFLSFFPAIFVLKNSIMVVLSSGYHSLYLQESATSFTAAPKILADFLVPASLFLLAGSKEKPKGRLVSGTMIFIYVMTNFFLGQRNQAVMPLVSFAWIWHRLIHPIPKTFLLGMSSLITFVIFPLVAITRNTAGQNRLSITVLLEAFSSIDNPFIASISEMGGTMLTIAYTIQLVPSNRNYQMGTDYLYALLTLIPNVFGKLHPTIARGLDEKWLTEEISPYLASIGGSVGFSFIAEAYLNFGWVGTPIALGVIGFFFVNLILWAVRYNDPAKMAMLASFISFFLFYTRSESALVVRPLVWYSLIPYLGVYVLNTSLSKRLAR